MSYEIILAPQAVDDLRRLRANLRGEVRDAMERHLRFEPTKAGRSRIKRLRGLSRPQYRLRVGEVRVYYDVQGSVVDVIAIVPKARAEQWLRRAGE
jgi:mRNA-degrading endonuclease RelE of RelBE toxin-antitoxin system